MYGWQRSFRLKLQIEGEGTYIRACTADMKGQDASAGIEPIRMESWKQQSHLGRTRWGKRAEQHFNTSLTLMCRTHVPFWVPVAVPMNSSVEASSASRHDLARLSLTTTPAPKCSAKFTKKNQLVRLSDRREVATLQQFKTYPDTAES